MAKKIARIQFTQQQLEGLKRQNGLSLTDFVRQAADHFILQVRE